MKLSLWNLFCYDLHKLIFNYSLSRARQIIENTFRVLASRFRIFRRAIIDKTENIKNIIKVAVILHNFPMRKSTRNMYCQPDYVDKKTSQGLSPGSWRNKATEIQGLIHLRAQGSNNSTRPAKKVQIDSKDYFNWEQGKLIWQRETVQSTTSLFDEVDWNE